MKLVILPAAFMFFLSFIQLNANAQLPHASIYGHVLYATALDRSSQTLYNGGFGGVAGVLVGPGNTRFNGSLGYTHFIADNSTNQLGSESYVPLKVGIRQYIPLTFHFLYAQANAGVGFVSNKNSDNKGSRFAFDFGAGVKFGAFEAALIWDSFKEIHPNGWSSWVTVQAGFNLGF